MLGIDRKILSAFLFLALSLSVAHLCVEECAKSFDSSTIQLASDATASSDMASDDTLLHACHLGCCAVLSFRDQGIQHPRKNGPVRAHQMHNLSRLMPADFFRPPII